MRKYIALLRKEKESSFGVDFPDFPGCITAGETLEEASERAPQALQFHMKGMVEDGDPIPEPRSLDEVMDLPEARGAVPFPVLVPEPKTKRINITLPETVLVEIDAHAKKIKLSRSAFLVMAAKKAMTG